MHSIIRKKSPKAASIIVSQVWKPLPEAVYNLCGKHFVSPKINHSFVTKINCRFMTGKDLKNDGKDKIE